MGAARLRAAVLALPCTGSAGHGPSPALAASAALELCLAAGAGTSGVPTWAKNKQGSRAAAGQRGGRSIWRGKANSPSCSRSSAWAGSRLRGAGLQGWPAAGEGWGGHRAGPGFGGATRLPVRRPSVGGGQTFVS